MAAFEAPLSEVHFVYQHFVDVVGVGGVVVVSVNPLKPVGGIPGGDPLECAVDPWVQHLHRPFGVGCKADACTDLAEAVSPFVDADIDVSTEQAQGKSHAGNAAADDSNLNVVFVRHGLANVHR